MCFRSFLSLALINPPSDPSLNKFEKIKNDPPACSTRDLLEFAVVNLGYLSVEIVTNQRKKYNPADAEV